MVQERSTIKHLKNGHYIKHILGVAVMLTGSWELYADFIGAAADTT